MADVAAKDWGHVKWIPIPDVTKLRRSTQGNRTARVAAGRSRHGSAIWRQRMSFSSETSWMCLSLPLGKGGESSNGADDPWGLHQRHFIERIDGLVGCDVVVTWVDPLRRRESVFGSCSLVTGGILSPA